MFQFIAIKTKYCEKSSKFEDFFFSKLYVAFKRNFSWDGCSAHDIVKPEKVQLSAARLVTGLPISASRENLYKKQVGKLYKIDITLQEWLQCSKFTKVVTHLT